MMSLVRPHGAINKVRVEWRETQGKLCREAVAAKQSATHKLDVQQNRDLAFLQAIGGPFSSVGALSEFLWSAFLDDEKQAQLYTEVRFAKNSSLI